MIEDDKFQKLWEDSSDDLQIELSPEKLRDSLKKKRTKFRKSLVLRNLGETAAALFVIIFFSIQAAKLPWIISKTGAGIIVLSNIFILIAFIRNSQKLTRTDYSLTVSEGLKSFKRDIEREIRLIKSIWLWYILPPFCGILIFLTGFPPEVTMKYIAAGITLFTFIAVFIANRMYLKKKLNPLLIQIEESLVSIEKESSFQQ